MANFEQSLTSFLDHYEKLNRNLEVEDGFLKEFMALKGQSQRYKEQNTYPADSGLLPYNKKKNRFKDILPYEHTRVTLHPIEGIEGSDYINANYVMGMDDEIVYIAAQGPLPNTIDDFWRMLWYHNIEVVVMACKEVEMGKRKCEHYWPDQNEWVHYGAIKVTTSYEENVSNDFVIRDLLAECDGEQQHIRQYHYLSWPDHGKPSSPEPIIRMLQMVKDYRKRLDTPLLVHCSAGCGRTGTLLSIDIAKNMLETKNVPAGFNVYKIVERMRQQRPAMVQAKDQYLFVYLAVVELAKRALGQQPSVPPKPENKKKPSNGKNSTPGDLSVYENVEPRSKSPTSELQNPSAPPRKSAPYENANPGSQPPLRATNGQHSPPMTRPKPTVSRKLSGPMEDKTEKRNGQEVPHQYENVKKSSPPPAPKPRIRKRHSRNSIEQPNLTPVQAKERPASPQPPTTPPRAPTPQRPLLETLPKVPTPQRPLPEIPPKVPTPQRPLPETPPKVPTSQRPLPETPPKVPTPQRPLPEIPPVAPNPENEKEPVAESLYSVVDPTRFRDLGPEIQLVDEETGRRAPLKKVEREMEKTAGTTDLTEMESTKKSILDTIMSIVGDVPEDIGRESPELPPPIPPPIPQSKPEDAFKTRFPDEVPPEIPVRTAASRELMNEPISLPPKSPSSGDLSSAIYEQPTPFSKPVVTVDNLSPRKAPLGTSYSSPYTLSPSASSSTAQSITTLPRGNPTPSPSSSSTFAAVGGILSKLKKKSEKKKPTIEDISGPVVIGNSAVIVKSSSDHKIHSGSFTPPQDTSGSSNLDVGGSQQSVVRSLSDELKKQQSANEIKFPGNLGYGVRVSKPRGPRPEPPHWKAIPNSIV